MGTAKQASACRQHEHSASTGDEYEENHVGSHTLDPHPKIKALFSHPDFVTAVYKKRDWMETLAKGPPASGPWSESTQTFGCEKGEDAVHTLKPSKINQSQPKVGQIVLVCFFFHCSQYPRKSRGSSGRDTVHYKFQYCPFQTAFE